MKREPVIVFINDIRKGDKPPFVTIPTKEYDDLVAALTAARDHLDWIGYGDTYEREAAHGSKLEKQIGDALTLAGKVGE